MGFPYKRLAFCDLVTSQVIFHKDEKRYWRCGYDRCSKLNNFEQSECSCGFDRIIASQLIKTYPTKRSY